MEESKEIDVKDSDEFLTALYLFDETELQHCKQENLDQKQVSALVYIDNYDEALDSIEDVKRSLLIALVDRKVNQYFSKMDALVRKIEKDKYFVVFKYKYLQKLMDDRFSVLEDVKTVKVGNEMAVTLSIGVGIKGLLITRTMSRHVRQLIWHSDEVGIRSLSKMVRTLHILEARQNRWSATPV